MRLVFENKGVTSKSSKIRTYAFAACFAVDLGRLRGVALSSDASTVEDFSGERAAFLGGHTLRCPESGVIVAWRQDLRR